MLRLKKLTKISNYLKSISKGSTKRVVFLYSVLVILTPLCYVYTSDENFEIVLAELLGFLSFLAGGNIYESINSKNNGKL